MTKALQEIAALDAGGDAYPRLLVPLPLSEDGTPPAEMRLFQAGENPSTQGVFLFSSKSAESVMAEFLARGVEKPGDYNHASLPQRREDGTTRRPTAEEGKASCRYQLEVRPSEAGPELWAVNIRWTPDADRMIRAKEYYQTSNTFAHTDKGEVTRFVNFALVNDPAMLNQPALVAASATAEPPTTPPPAAENKDDTTMKLSEKACAALKALMDGEYKDEAEMMAKCKSALADAGLLPIEEKKKEEAPAEMSAQLSTLSALRTNVVALTGKATDAEALAVLNAHKEEAGKVAALTARVAELEGQTVDREFSAALEKGKADGKLTPADVKGETKRGKYLAGLRADKAHGVAALNAFVDELPKLVSTEETKEKEGEKVAALSAEEAEIDRLFGHESKDITPRK